MAELATAFLREGGFMDMGILGDRLVPMDEKAGELRENARRVSTLLKAMGNERRLIVLCYLVEGERSVSELESLIGISQSALSQHLARLRRDGLVETRRSAQNIFYSVASREVKELLESLHHILCRPSRTQPVDGQAIVAETIC